MRYTYEDYEKSAEFLRSKVRGFQPEVVLILGSGLGSIGKIVENPVMVSYGDIPGMQASTAPGHAGKLILGTLLGKHVAIMQGRLHLYEGYGMEDAAFLPRVLRIWGASKLIATNACGSVNRDFHVGELMLISDHIKLFLPSPLTGANLSPLGPRFPDMTYAYSARLRQAAKDSAHALGTTLREGVYMFFPGPQYETPAEIRAARALGADVVGMSTVPEVIAAVHAGIEVLGISLISNMAAGILDQKLSEEEVLEAGKAAYGTFSKLLTELLKRI